ncbi:hypothetical protein QI633_08185 [Nocardioides sp. QY071]|uniref:hypothetical protein n=1 Tax=Nocardioides sp. QY071 TaxID=3044187 RepID=UPI00249C7105|nr:hypothetical protein [Nocardioides sp. QY071]WGY03731.1 hypothetical protein QI633_08185 [Nocardioides sp. QY071]
MLEPVLQLAVGRAVEVEPAVAEAVAARLGIEPTEIEVLFDEGQQRTHAQAITRAAKAFANTLATCAQMTAREQAEAAWTPTGPYTVDELEDQIREDRGMAPLGR